PRRGHLPRGRLAAHRRARVRLVPDDAPCGVRRPADPYDAGVTVDLLELLPAGWRERVRPHLDPASVAALSEFVAGEYQAGAVYPPLPDLFTAFRLCDPAAARVLILGQDPYHKAGQAHGLSFSVRQGVPVPPSLRNIFKELRADLGAPAPAHGDLSG